MIFSRLARRMAAVARAINSFRSRLLLILIHLNRSCFPSVLVASMSLASLVPCRVQAAEPKELRERIRVRMQSQLTQIHLRGAGLRVQGMNYSFKPVAIPQNESLDIDRFEKEGRTYWMVKSSLKENPQIIANEYLLIEAKNLKNGAQSLPSQIILAPGKSRTKIDLIGVLPLEEYLVGVLASEMPLSWPLETLKAQAVAARSYALVMMKERSKKPYHLESSVLDQVFKHVLLEDDQDALTRKAALAVKSTRGLRLATSKGLTLKAFYHSDCGGKTASAKSVWNGGEDAGEATDDSCPANPKSNWVYRLDKKKLFGKLSKSLREQLREKRTKPGMRPAEREIASLEFIRIPGEDRVKEVKLAFNDDTSKVINGNDFRGAVGFQDLKSLVFASTDTPDEIIFHGRGFGHGVGLCQWGSRALGLQGKSYEEILKHYYPLASLKN